jgi:tRNA (guanine10-N2)-dimethyltransferase
MFASLCILGRQPALGLAELESLYGSDAIKPVGTKAAFVDLPPADIDHPRLGGSIKVCKVLTEIPSTDWNVITEYLVEHVPKHVCCLVPGKVKFGISVYDHKFNPRAINATGLSVKKASKAVERSMRVVPNKEQALNAAQVLNNKMTDELGMELVLVRNANKTILAQTTSVQDIDAYAARDQERPARDARVGMLPPKLAQTIINLASPSDDSSILDPFCGTGVLLQEGILMGNDVYGTDIEERMIEYSRKNLDWLSQEYPERLADRTYLLETGDACSYQWQDFDVIACETYLGRPFSTEPNPDKLREVMQDVDTIHRKFLGNVARQTKAGFRICIAIPAWHTKNGVKHLPMLDHLTDMGYTRISFVHSKNKDLVYHRENQIVGRELVVLIRK